MSEKQNIALFLSYVGTAYHGWQIQNNGMTVQEAMQDAVRKTTEQSVSLSGCGRTDAGVHARVYVCNASLATSIPCARLPLALNARLPDDIVVKEARIVPGRFDSRFSCRKKEYTYTIHNSRVRDPFLLARACYFPYPLDFDRVRAAAAEFVGTHDFAAVQRKGSPVKTTVRTIYRCEAEKSGDVITVRVCGNGFLYNMVRAITGTLLYAGLHKLEPGEIASILASRDRSLAGPTLPAAGLALTGLWYDEFTLT
ncbi:MAG: tRNA pseudouridine(38-40) synthase TruA [Clostridiaceae bacterium]|nr:tRNA pseudouridine(38-40) synthase TruA [Clostridiaceae bacterium]